MNGAARVSDSFPARAGPGAYVPNVNSTRHELKGRFSEDLRRNQLGRSSRDTPALLAGMGRWCGGGRGLGKFLEAQRDSPAVHSSSKKIRTEVLHARSRDLWRLFWWPRERQSFGPRPKKHVDLVTCSAKEGRPGEVPRCPRPRDGGPLAALALGSWLWGNV